jgi:predicted secreted protein
MAAYTGAAFLLKTGTWSGGVVVAACKTNTMTINGTFVDTSSKDSFWRTGLAGGLSSVTISGDGVVTDVAGYETFQGYALAAPKTANPLAMGWADGDIAEGTFIITSFAITGELEGAQTFSFTAESVSAVTFTQA